MKTSDDRAAPAGGVYVLLIDLPEGRTIRVGALGELTFDAGGYAYVGSAMNGIHQRIQRHLREEKRLHWHVDYLLEHGHIDDAVTVRTSDSDLECEIARKLSKCLQATDGFGCSDCSCSSHLFYCPDIVQLRQHVNEAIAHANT